MSRSGCARRRRRIRKAADAYKVYYAKVSLKGVALYTIDHSSFIYLMSQEGKYLGFLPPSPSADRKAQVLRTQLQGAEK